MEISHSPISYVLLTTGGGGGATGATGERNRLVCLRRTPHATLSVVGDSLTHLPAQEENSGLRAQLELLRAAPAPAATVGAEPGEWASLAAARPPRAAVLYPSSTGAPAGGPASFDVTPLCGAFEAQRQYLRGRSANRHALRKAIHRMDDHGIRIHLSALEEQRARHVRSEWKNLRKIQKVLEGELDMSLELDGEPSSPFQDEVDSDLYELQQNLRRSRRPIDAEPVMSAHHHRVDTTSVVMQQHHTWLQNFSATH